jgi:hypothetical protein
LIKELNYTPKGEKDMKQIMQSEQKLMALKKIRKIFTENFLNNNHNNKGYKNENENEIDNKRKKRPNYNFKKIVINFYGIKTDVQMDKSHNVKINLSYPINEELLVRLINNKIEELKKKSNISIDF